MAPKRRYLLLR